MFRRSLLLVCLAATFLALAAPATACPYSSIQVRVQPNNLMPWATSISIPKNTSYHIGVFKNGWGVPVDPGTVTLFRSDGYNVYPMSLQGGWEAFDQRNYNDTFTYVASCGGLQATATVQVTDAIDVLSYILPPSHPTGGKHTVISNKGNPWRTWAPANGNVGEWLPGFYITKGQVNYVAPYKAWLFEQMIYDNQWIYLVRDTSWTSRCTDTNHEAGMLLFTNHNGTWKRGGRHFPRAINLGASVWTGDKYVQGVEVRKNVKDSVSFEGRWCPAEYAGTGQTKIQALHSPSVSLGGDTYHDVLKLKAVDGLGSPDEWWFARGVGLIRFGDGAQLETADSVDWNYELGVRIPCEPNAPCM